MTLAQGFVPVLEVRVASAGLTPEVETQPAALGQMIYENFLRSGGVMMLGGVQLLTPGPDPMEDQRRLRDFSAFVLCRGPGKCLRHRWLFALSDFLIKEGHQIKCFADASSGAYTWWIQRKRSCRLALSRLVSYCEDTSVHEPSHKALYDINADVLGSLACRYAGAGGDYPLPPRAIAASAEIPSTRIYDNLEFLSDAERARNAPTLKIHVPRSELDVKSCIQAWMESDV